MNRDFKRIVVKIGTNSLMKGGKVNKAIIRSLASELSQLRFAGRDMILVTSGAIGFGIERLGIGFPKKTRVQQAMAAIGQNLLMHEYEREFRKHGQVIGQVLLTPETFASKSQLENLCNAVETLFSYNALPIINENDAVSVEALSSEKVFSDNDGLAVLLAERFNADLMIMLTDVDGIFTENPKGNTKAEKIRGLKHLFSARIKAGKKSDYGIGGVSSKILAVKRAVHSGISVVVCKARKGAVLDAAGNNSSGSFFGGAKNG